MLYRLWCMCALLPASSLPAVGVMSVAAFRETYKRIAQLPRDWFALNLADNQKLYAHAYFWNRDGESAKKKTNQTRRTLRFADKNRRNRFFKVVSKKNRVFEGQKSHIDILWRKRRRWLVSDSTKKKIKNRIIRANSIYSTLVTDDIPVP